jgi:hypothetical protein
MKVHLQLMKDKFNCYNSELTQAYYTLWMALHFLQDLQIMLAQVCGFSKTLSSSKMVYK